VEEIIRRLRSLGLSGYEAKAYLTLLDKGDLSAEDLSRNSNIPLPRVYVVIDMLSTKGFVKVIEGRPKLFEAIEPEEALNNYTSYLEGKLREDIERRRKEALKSLPKLKEIYWRNRLKITPEKLSEELSSLRDMEIKTVEIMSSANRSIDVFTSHFKWLSRVEDVLKSAVSRNVNVRVLMQIDDKDSAERALRLLKIGVNVRNSCEAWYPTRGTIVDNSKLIYLIWVSDSARVGKPTVYKPQYTENEGLIAVFRESFENRWLKSRDPMESIRSM
jgi:sugar-specific transcriptional regulator TrmB